MRSARDPRADITEARCAPKVSSSNAASSLRLWFLTPLIRALPLIMGGPGKSYPRTACHETASSSRLVHRSLLTTAASAAPSVAGLSAGAVARSRVSPTTALLEIGVPNN